jgi:hypothetical protein
MSAFRDNLDEIVRVFRGAGARVLVGSVPSNLYRPDKRAQGHLELFAPVLRFYEQGDWAAGRRLMRELLRNFPYRHQSSDFENEIIAEITWREHVPMVDIQSAVSAAEPHGVPGETLMYDHCHLKPAGRAIWLSEFEKAIAND